MSERSDGEWVDICATQAARAEKAEARLAEETALRAQAEQERDGLREDLRRHEAARVSWSKLASAACDAAGVKMLDLGWEDPAGRLHAFVAALRSRAEQADALKREYEKALDLGYRRVDDALAALYGIDYDEESRVGRAVARLEEFVNSRLSVAASGGREAP